MKNTFLTGKERQLMIMLYEHNRFDKQTTLSELF